MIESNHHFIQHLSHLEEWRPDPVDQDQVLVAGLRLPGGGQHPGGGQGLASRPGQGAGGQHLQVVGGGGQEGDEETLGHNLVRPLRPQGLTE